MSRRRPPHPVFLFPPIYIVLRSIIIAAPLSIKITYTYQFNWFFRSISAIQSWRKRREKTTTERLPDSININDMDLTMCCTNEAKAHIWHEKYTTKENKKREENYTCSTGWKGGVKARGRKAKGEKQRVGKTKHEKAPIKKWKMPRLFL